MENLIRKPYEISLWEDKICYAVRLLEAVNDKNKEDHDQGRYFLEGNENVYYQDFENYDESKNYYKLIKKSDGNYKESFEIKDLDGWEPTTDINAPKVIIQFYHETKLCVLGSNTMDAPCRAISPKFVEKVNGELTLTFTMYYRYFDEEVGDFVTNPFTGLLSNERKIKLYYDEHWYDLIVKNITEDSSNYTFSYTCKSLHINELSKTGFNVELNSELENNMGNIVYLAKEILKDTDWQVNEEKTEQFKQYIEEPLYRLKLKSKIDAFDMESPDNKITIEPTDEIVYIYGFYNCIANKSSYFQFLYVKDGYEIDDDYVITNSPNYAIDGTTYDSEWPSFVEYGEISTDYRGKRLVRQLLTKYDSGLDRYVNVYEKNGAEYYGYTETEYFSPIVVKNYVTSPNSFSSTAGWIAGADSKGQFATLELKGYPDIRYSKDQTDFVSLLHVKTSGNQYIFNSGFQDNKSVIYNNLTENKKFVFKIKMHKATMLDAYVGTLGELTYPSLIKICTYTADGKYIPNEGNLFTFKEDWKMYNNEYYYTIATCNQSISYKDLLEQRYGIFISLPSGEDYCIEDFQIFEYIEKDNLFYLPDTTPEAEIKTKYHYYSPIFKGSSSDEITYIYQGYEKQDDYVPKYNDEIHKFEKIRSIESKESNCFNLIQELNETFECWSKFDVKHESTGQIALDDNYHQIKSIYFKEYIGKTNWAGFKRGINLSSTKRTLDSEGVVTKLIVKSNQNEFAKNGFCSIARAPENPTGENFIIDFSYYVRQKMLNNSTYINDLYLDVNGYLGYYKKLSRLNANLDEDVEKLAGLITEIANYEAQFKASKTAYEESDRVLQEQYAYILKLTGYTFDHLVNEYNKNSEASNWWNVEEARKALEAISHLRGINQTAKKAKETYEKNLKVSQELQASLQLELDKLAEQKRKLNLQFYKKYSRFLQEGSWIEENYIDDTLYYFDAQSTLRTSTTPKVSYTINILELSQLEGYENYKFELGDKSYIEDTEFFGWFLKDGVYTPYQEEIIISERTVALDSPEQNTLKVQNYKTQFEDLFQRITATTQSLEYHTGEYNKTSNIIESDGTINFDTLQNSMASNSLRLENAKDQSVVIDEYGITSTNLSRPSEMVRLVSGGLFMSEDGGATWKTGITGSGINAEYITSGTLNTSKINIMSGSYPSFRWNDYGISAYEFIRNEDGQISNFKSSNFVRFDQFGIYGIRGDSNFLAISEDDILNSNAMRFSLTWGGFRLKSDGANGYISITSDNDFQTFANGLEKVKIGRLAEQSYQKVDIDENSFVPGAYYYFDLETFTYQVAQEYIENQSYYKRYEEKYGIRISDNFGNPVMETGDDGQLWLREALRVGKEDGENVFIGYKLDATGAQVINAANNFIVYDDGTIKANKGYLGKVEITNEGLSVVDGKITIYKKEYEVSDPQPSAENFTEENYYIYSEESKEYKPATEFMQDTIYYVLRPRDVLSQDESGNIKIEGEIQAVKGSIGGFSITEDAIQSSNDSIKLQSNGTAIFQNAILGEGLNIENYIKLGQAYIYNPNINSNKFIQSGNILLDQNGMLQIGDIVIDGSTDTSLIKGGKYDESSAGWKILEDGSAYFRDIYVDEVHMKNSILEIGTIQSVGSTMLFEDCWPIKEIAEDGMSLTIEGLASLKEDEYIYCDNVAYKIVEVLYDNSGITTLAINKPFVGKKSSIIVRFGTPQKDSIFSVCGADHKFGDSNFSPFAQGNALTLTDFEVDKDGELSYKKRLVLGKLDEIEGLSGYGLYADNVYLKGSLTTATMDDGNGATYAGINTLSGIPFIQDTRGKDTSKIIFWAGANTPLSEDIQDAPFQVTEAGTVYATKAIFTESVFAGGSITGADLYAARIHGWNDEQSAALTIYDAAKGISFKTGYDYSNKNEDASKEVFNIGTEGFKIGDNNFIKIDETGVEFIGRVKTDLVQSINPLGVIKIESKEVQVTNDFIVGDQSQHQLQYKMFTGENGGYDLYVI